MSRHLCKPPTTSTSGDTGRSNLANVDLSPRDADFETSYVVVARADAVPSVSKILSTDGPIWISETRRFSFQVVFVDRRGESVFRQKFHETKFRWVLYLSKFVIF